MTTLGDFTLNQIYTGDARELGQGIPDRSVDLIFTDPPYLREFLPLYEWLVSFAERILRPGGFVLAYCGNVWKGEIYRYFLASGLSYHWDYTVLHAGMGSVVWARRTVARGKSIVAFSKGKSLPRTNVLGVYTGAGQDKRRHLWGQDAREARYFIDCFTLPGSVVVDPFIGGGTTADACNVLGRNFVGFELDPVTAERARERVSNSQPPLFAVELEQSELFGSAL
jgi:site-specific DNA-methyltransferase (adenine-specific)